MKSIRIKDIQICNFKGIRNMQIDFNGYNAIISGGNATGKSTVADAFTWCLFGKNKANQSDFGIKTIDPETKEPVPGIEHYVDITLIVDEKEKRFRRTLVEKTIDGVLTGNETVYHVNGIMMKKKDFDAEIASIADEQLFRTITDPMYFTSLEWKQQRQILCDIIGKTDYVGLAETDIEKETATILNDTDSELLKKTYRSQVKATEEEIAKTRGIIEGIEKSRPLYDENADYEKLISEKENEIKKIDDKIAGSDRSLESEASVLKSELELMLETEKNRMKEKSISVTNAILEKESELRRQKDVKNELEMKKKSIGRKIDENKKEIIESQNRLTELRTKWYEENSRTQDCTKCPVTGRECPDDEYRKCSAESFDKFKSEQLEKINAEGKMTSEKINSLGKENSELEKESALAEENMKDIESKIKDTEEKIHELSSEKESMSFVKTSEIEGYSEKEERFVMLQKQIEMKRTDEKTLHDALENDRKLLNSDIDELKLKLSAKKMSKDFDMRIDEQKKKITSLSIELDKISVRIGAIDMLVSRHSGMIEKKVNGMFRWVRFQMFEKQLNGTMSMTCKAVDEDGVKFNDWNTSKKTNGGIDIINMLSRHYGITAPIFIDNAEGINRIENTDSQMIMLMVSDEEELNINILK